VRIKKVIGVGALVGGLGLGAAACGPVNVHWEKYPTGTSTSPRAAEQHWWVNGGGDDAVYVNKAQAAATNDAFGSGVPLSTDRADGIALEHDAQAAARNPYPGNPADYGILMGDLAAAGRYLSTGDTSDALTQLYAANAEAGAAGWLSDFPAAPGNLTS
jgi:hypothetical protein